MPQTRPRPPTRQRATVDRILQMTIDMLDEHGESGLRVEEVLAASGASTSSMYHHFENRDGLIDAARAVGFARQAAEDVEALRVALDGTEDRDDLLARFDAITRRTITPDRAPQRRRRVAILGWAAQRPSLWEALGEEQQRVTDSLAGLIRTGQDRGLVRTDLDAQAMAEFVLAYPFGRVLGDLNARPADTEEWYKVVDLVVRLFVVEG